MSTQRPNPSPPEGEGGGTSVQPGEGDELKQRARQMRLHPTDAERKLWYALRGRRFLNFKFRRQVPVGPYIADFLSFETRLIVEVDGGQHSDNEQDGLRDLWFRRRGY